MSIASCDSGLLPTVQQLVNALTPDQHEKMIQFAGKRIRRLQGNAAGQRYLSTITPEDIVHEALHRLLLGEVHPLKGRKLTSKNRRSPEAFVTGVLSVINSILSNVIRTTEFSTAHLPLVDAGEPEGVDFPDPHDLIRRLERRDLYREMFVRLRQQAAADLQPIIDEWETCYFSDRSIASTDQDRRDVYRLRVLARDILRSLTRETRLHSRGPLELVI